MRFLATLLLFCAWLQVQVLAYAEAGAFERVFFYYLYLIEIDVYGKSKSITPACGRVMRTGGVPCSYDQWVNYVQNKEDPVNYPRITNQPYEKGVYPDLEKTKTLTSKSGQTDRLNPGRVIEGFKADGTEVQKYALFLQKGAETLQRISLDGRFTEAMRTNGVSALRSVMIQRMSASVDTFKEKEAAEGRKVTVTERFYDPKNEDWGKVKDFDQRAYVADNPGSTMKDLKQRWKAVYDAGHSENIASLKAVWEEMLDGAC